MTVDYRNDRREGKKKDRKKTENVRKKENMTGM